uniref:CACTA en-spm transposon protein n=1 Tax=Cucumis melo TaxID=3656 RepID=A0A9I9E8I7_CUCME
MIILDAFIIDSVLYFTELKLKGKGRRENRRGLAVRSSPPSILSSSPSLTIPPPSATLVIMSSSYPCNNFMEMDVMFLEFENDLDNIAGGSSFVGDNMRFSSQQPATPTPRRRAQSRLLELERHVAINGHIPMMIALERRNLFPHTPFVSARR